MSIHTDVERQHRSLATPAGAALVAAVVVLRHLDTKPLWRDEAISVSVAARPVARILPVLTHHDANAGLYYLLLHGWLRLGGGARGFSALCFVVGAGLAAWAVARWRGRAVGAACGLLMATNPFLVYYGQEARPYALAACLAVVSTIALFWRGGGPAPRAHTVATIALLYSDLFAVLFVAAMAGAIVVVQRRRGEPVPRVLVRCWAVVAAASAPLALVMLLGQRGQISWLPRPRLADLEFTVTRMTGGWIGFWVVAGLGVLGVGAAARTRRTRPARRAESDRPVVSALAAAAVLPAPVLFAVAQIMPCFIDRYVIASAVAVVGMAAAGLDELRRRAGTVLALAALALLVGLGLQRAATLEAQPFKVDDAPAVVAFITARAAPGDAIGYAGGGLRMVISASASASASVGRAADAAAAFPTDVIMAPGGEAFRQHDLYAREVTAAELARRLGPVSRLWVVTDPTDNRYPRDGPLAQLRSSVLAEFTPGAGGSFGAIDVTLYTRRSP